MSVSDFLRQMKENEQVPSPYSHSVLVHIVKRAIAWPNQLAKCEDIAFYSLDNDPSFYFVSLEGLLGELEVAGSGLFPKLPARCTIPDDSLLLRTSWFVWMAIWIHPLFTVFPLLLRDDTFPSFFFFLSQSKTTLFTSRVWGPSSRFRKPF